MTTTRMCSITAILAAVLFGLVPTSAKETETAQRMRTAAAAFLATLDEAPRSQALFEFNVDERLNWHFVPRERKGLSLKAMTPAQRKAAVDLLQTSLSDKGFQKAEGIRSLEPILWELQKQQGTVRDADLYYVSIFGTPSADQPWGWRYEGHHLAQNWTVIGGSAIASSPQFFGANPARVMDGPRVGTRVLASEEDLARTFLTSLDAAQQKEAIVDPEAPRDILTMNQREIAALDPAGIPYAKLSGGQQKLLLRVIEEYAFAQAKTIGEARMAAIRKASLDPIRFAWLGPTERGAKHYYRIQGPTFLIEYDNTQSNGNHIHSVWRDFKGDFGRDLLAEHYRRDHVPPAVAPEP